MLLFFYGILKLMFFFYSTILHSACESGNVNLVKFIVSLNKIDVKVSDNMILKQ